MGQKQTSAKLAIRSALGKQRTFSRQHANNLVSHMAVPSPGLPVRCNPSHVLRQEAADVPLAVKSAPENAGQ
jgi:hypothetical protein